MNFFKKLLTQDVGVAPEEVVQPTENGLLGGLISTIVNWAANVGVKIVIALVILAVTFKIISKIARKIEKAGDKPNHDKTLMRVLAYIVSIGGKCLIAVCLIGYLGIDTSGITALIASFGVCFGLAVNGAVANIAGGVLIIVTRPFKVDDFIEAQGVSGTVTDIHMVSTKIVTPDNKVIYIPNGSLANANIINYSEKSERRVDLVFSIAYENNFETAKAIIADICAKHELILQDKGVTIRVSAHSESSIDIKAMVWTKSSDYWTVNFDLLEMVKKEFDEKGIAIPYNQLDVHVKND